MKIDINCDMGESFGQFKIGNDTELFPYITSCNIACGFHGGDPYHIEKTIKHAISHGVQIGAHPSYPDLAGFGRRKMQLSVEELSAIIKYQVAALKGMTESCGGKLKYVKPHGALYNSIADDDQEATVVIEAIQAVDDQLAIMGLAGSGIESLATKKGIRFIKEAFADRKYTSEGRLESRSKENAVISNPQEAAKQVMHMVMHGKVRASDMSEVDIAADSVCIHGDNPSAVNILQAIRNTARENNISIEAFAI
ncbi:5-oxoprolinase subunit PxpA [Fulvivirga sp. RKSG066]|uniref:LamB/YcsF family protein n=1 Tax=Fulvivirga aurantia TaxID=2529383 RepID=UPI0012BD23AE|nr:5-oxoprolinase subunit PxpA [Fulvivirga aurantia]MTI20360.1 5-oxoprolinase subunit PxpA [Fulvivirga aurantia]